MNRATVWQSGMTIPISEETRIALEELGEQTHEPMQTVLAKAVDSYWRQHLIDAHNVAYAALRANPQAWQEELDERRAWDVTLADGLTDDKPMSNGSQEA